MARRSRLWSILRAAEDFLIAFDDYFRRPGWVAGTAGFDMKRYQRSVAFRTQEKKRFSDIPKIKKEESVLTLVAKPWDGKWRLVCYDVPEKQRKDRRFVKENLYELGFRKLQRSVWISSLPIDPWLKELQKRVGDISSFYVLTANLSDINPKDLVKKLWLDEGWQEEASKLLKEIKSSESLNVEQKRRFWDLVLDHPKVPLELLPYNWPLDELVKLFSSKNRGKDDMI